ncbi:hypothetical protein BD410DRAFT_901117 [Rickenella mellea]|uniref:Uncharacterized protein n=1 Tax=Rickenella mellea TaxID=50990 RepID=A0A4Y7PSB2_9AGAM|nr:hypothetical protein BD410DRAFT_901117 [Rickenella mellea]
MNPRSIIISLAVVFASVAASPIESAVASELSNSRICAEGCNYPVSNTTITTTSTTSGAQSTSPGKALAVTVVGGILYSIL